MQNMGIGLFLKKNRPREAMGTSTSKTNRHVFNNSDLDIQIYEISKSRKIAKEPGGLCATVSDNLDGVYLAGAGLAGMNDVSDVLWTF